MAQGKVKLDESIGAVEVCRVDQFLPHPLVQEEAVSGSQVGGVQENQLLLQCVEFTAPRTSLDVLAWLLKRTGSFLAGNIFIPAKPTGHTWPFSLEDGTGGSPGLLQVQLLRRITEELAPESAGTEPLLKDRSSWHGDSMGIRPWSRGQMTQE